MRGITYVALSLYYGGLSSMVMDPTMSKEWKENARRTMRTIEDYWKKEDKALRLRMKSTGSASRRRPSLPGRSANG